MSGPVRNMARLAGSAFVLLALIAGLIVPGANADASDSCGSSACDEAAVAQLAVLYAYGIDSIGQGAFNEGIAILQKVFTPDAIINVCFAPGQCVTKTGALEWAQFSAGVFSAGGYYLTQHQVGNQKVELSINKQSGTMVSYLTASHFKSGSSNIDLFHGFYTDQVVKQPGGGWRISNRDLHTKSFVRVAGSPVV